MTTWQEKITKLRASGVDLDLPTLLALARTHEMSEEEVEEQRMNYVVGCLLESNPKMRRSRAESLYLDAKKKYGL